MPRRMIGTVIVCVLLVIAAATAVFYVRKTTNNETTEHQGTEFVEMLPAETVPELVTAEQLKDQDAAGTYDYQFLLVNSDNYVTVYSVPEKEIYEYTDVIMDVLPVELQMEIDTGKYLKDEEELYNFLENYTS